MISNNASSDNAIILEGMAPPKKQMVPKYLKENQIIQNKTNITTNH